ALARARDKRIYALDFDGHGQIDLLADLQSFDMRADGAYAALQRELNTAFDPEGEFELKDRAPYPGLHAFDSADAAVFYGRTDEVLELTRRLDPKLSRGRVITVVGPSGSGKSSIVRAGVLPRLARSGWTVVGPIVPGEHPLAALERALG